MGFFTFFFFLIEVELIYNVVLVSGIQQNDSDIYIDRYTHIYIFFVIFFPIMFYYRILNTVSCALQ